MAARWVKAASSRNVVLVSSIGTLCGGIYLLRDSYRGVAFSKEIDCEGKIAIVTGGSSGIGKETARELAKRGATVFLLCRDMDRCRKTRKEIVFSTKNKYVYARECDLGCLDSVRKFAEEFLKTETKLDILINNAGVWRLQYGKTKDGFETHLGVNHMGHFLLTHLLLDTLIKSSPSRVINVTAATHARGKINKEDLNSEKKYSQLDAYNQSKLANILFTMELSERLKGTGVTANAVNPGTAMTGLYYKESKTFSETFTSIITKPFMWIFFKSPASAAQTTLYAALEPDLDKVTGKYFSNCKEEPLAENVKDEATAKWLWAVSEKWTRLKEHDEGNVTFT